MNKIGFTNKFYTLWNVEEIPTYSINPYTNENYISSTKIHNSFIKNLSFDFEKAKIKAGTTEFDPNLRGHKSFYSNIIYFDADILDEGDDTKIFFGKYKGLTLGEIFKLDRDYLEWLKNNTKNKQLSNIINSLPCLISESFDKFSEIENAISFSPGVDYIDIVFNKNLQLDPDTNKYETFVEVSDNYILQFLFPFAKKYYYNGFVYYLPLNSKGIAKRIKNKKILIHGIFSDVTINFDTMKRHQVIDVIDFKFYLT